MNGSPLHVIHGDQVFPGIKERTEQKRRKIIRGGHPALVTVPQKTPGSCQPANTNLCLQCSLEHRVSTVIRAKVLEQGYVEDAVHIPQPQGRLPAQP